MLMYIDIVQIEKSSQSRQRRLLLLLRYHMLNIRKTATHVEYNKVKLNIAINHWNFVYLTDFPKFALIPLCFHYE